MKTVFPAPISPRLDNADKATLFRNLEAYLLDVHRRGLRAILIIDEAQGMPHSALEELRMLSNIYQQGRPLLQVFLVGQPEFRRKLAVQGLEQLRQRIVAIHHLTPLSEEETKQYILHRLQRAGWNNDPRIAVNCLPLIHKESRGVPRLINNVCDRLLWHAFIEEKHEILSADVELVIDDMKIDATGIDLGGDPLSDIDLAAETEDEEIDSPVRQAATGAERVVDFRTSHEKDK